MRRLAVAALLVIVAGSAVHAQAGDQTYGEPITIKEVTPLAEILESLEEFVGKEVRTVGYIYSMCEGMGCWLGILPSLDSDQMVKIAWNHTDVRFPIGEETTGHYVEIQGEIITAEQEAEETTSKTRVVYVCPMHPDVVSESRERCSVCNMYLQKKEIAVPEFTLIAIKGSGAIVKEKK